MHFITGIVGKVKSRKLLVTATAVAATAGAAEITCSCGPLITPFIPENVAV